MRIKKNCTKQLEKFGNQGLRTLVYAEKTLTEEELINIEKQYMKALINLKEKNQKLNELYEACEQDLKIIGVTAIEDCLQDFLSKKIYLIRADVAVI